MKIAGVSMTYNDGYKLKEWHEHYLEYKDQLDIFVIVDNGSDKGYLDKVEKTFREAVIIKRQSNGGCTAAYNDGIRYVLNNTDAESIVIIGNDMKLSKNCLNTLYEYLFSDKRLGIVSTAILSINSDIVDNYGHTVDRFNVIECERGKKLSELVPECKYTDLVTGGFYMAKREFYDKVGLQDEKLFMYGDELDTAIRTKEANFLQGVTCKVFAWHWHIDNLDTGIRKPASNYLIARNRVYIAKKHFGISRELSSFWHFSVINALKLFIAGILKGKSDRIERAKYCFIGGINGLTGRMEKNKYMEF